ncbi:MAG: hypothetical protein N4A33_03630 [Bacteriovoracaceae bacterium]|jgi:hypothetical protein|nr:hypothetical protein [Bacteriovoracaceae bacterium]
MKAILLILLLICSNAFSRQYIQCRAHNTPHSFDSIVINLNTNDSTLYITNGVHLPDTDRVSILKQLSFVEIKDEYHLFQANDGKTQEMIAIRAQDIGVASSYFEVEMKITKLSNNDSMTKVYGCFSSLYED